MHQELTSTTHLTNEIMFSAQQVALFNWVANGKGHAVTIARAGTGKTFSALQAMRLMTGSITIAMFNADIAKETRGKLAKDEIKAFSTTFHAAGWSALLRFFKSIKLSGTDAGQAGYHKWDRIVEKLEIPKIYDAFAAKAMGLAKQRAFGVATPRLNDPAIFAHWLKLVDDFDLDMMIPEETFELLEKTGQTRETIIKDGLRWAAKALNLSNAMIEEVADHDDQIYAPLIKNIKMFESDWLIVDESQDTNPARRLLARKMLRRGGRALFIGDPAQAIYLFTGADNDSMDVITKEWNATVLKLTVTFRCPKVVVRMAQQFVPDYEAADTNIEGEYTSLTNEVFYKDVAKGLTPDTLVLCRNTAPLVQMAFKFIAANVACRVIGKDIGGQIVELVNRWKSVKNLRTLMDRLKDYQEKQTAKLMAAGKEAQADSLNDRVETVFAVIEGLPANSNLADLKAKVEEMFPKQRRGEVQKKVVRLMTMHRSKGLEEKTVVILGRKELCPSKFAKKPEQLAQERNLEYVALTRCQERLFDVKLAA